MYIRRTNTKSSSYRVAESTFIATASEPKDQGQGKSQSHIFVTELFSKSRTPSLRKRRLFTRKSSAKAARLVNRHLATVDETQQA